MAATDEKSQESERKKFKKLNCLCQWWNQTYSHQKRLESFLEHPLFHLLIIILVIGECASVIAEILLHNIKSQYACKYSRNLSRQNIDKNTFDLNDGIDISHYVSLGILSFFIFELLLKIYALGYHYWNCKENHKLDYFDAFLVVFSFSVEIYFLTVDKDSVIAYSAILIVVLRLWHLLRIANAILRCFQKGEEFKAVRRRRRSRKFSQVFLVPSSIQAVLDLMQEKTESLRRDISIEQSLIERFEEIDQKCQDAFDDYYGDELKLLQEIQKLHVITRTIHTKDESSMTV